MDIEEYEKGLENTGTELFYDVFARWKQLTPMEQELKEKVIKKIEKLMEKRTAGIMEANRRNYYGNAQLILRHWER